MYRHTFRVLQQASSSVVALMLVCLILAFGAQPAAALRRALPGWESLARKANTEMERGRYVQALKDYKAALSILERENAYDLRSAVIMKNIARVYKNRMRADLCRLWEGKAALIYKHEMDAGQLGAEYAQNETAHLEGQRLRPACPLCHENFKVIPLHLGEGTGYTGPVPSENDPRFTIKPGGSALNEERWYCKACKQLF